MKTKKSWNQKLHDSKGLPKIGKIEGKMSSRWGNGMMVVPAPLEVKAMMDKVPTGKIATINDIRGALAKKHGVDIACPITTGIFAWITAYAAEEAAQAGASAITPPTGGRPNRPGS